MKVREALQLAAEHCAAERIGDAETLYRSVLSVSPGNVRALMGLAEIGLRTAHPAEALELLQRAMQRRSDDPEIRAALAEALYSTGSVHQAETIFTELLAADSNCHFALRRFGDVLYTAQHYERAEPLLSRAAQLRPDSYALRMLLGMLLCVLSRPLDAAVNFERAVQLRPDRYAPHLLLGQAYLMAGDFPRGFEQMEWRSQMPGRSYPQFPQPRWRGQIEPGKTLLLVNEEGFGDVIQFTGFIPPLVDSGMDVVLTSGSELLDLLRTLRGVRIVSSGGSLERFDYHLPLLSLPLVLGATAQNLRFATRYLTADAELVATWRKRIGGSGRAGERNIGIAWSGRPAHVNDVNRSIPLAALTPLASIPGVRLHWLQNSPEGRRAIADADFPVVDHADHLKSFADTAALLTNLDLAIVVDTSVAHLAGALTRPVWIMLPHPPDGRWLMERSDTLWYPTARLFRQSRVGDWAGVIEQVRGALLANPVD